jgi:hypothetical protein
LLISETRGRAREPGERTMAIEPCASTEGTPWREEALDLATLARIPMPRAIAAATA